MTDKIFDNNNSGEDTVFTDIVDDTIDERNTNDMNDSFSQEDKFPTPDNIFAVNTIEIDTETLSPTQITYSNDDDGQCRIKDFPIYIQSEEILDDDVEIEEVKDSAPRKYDPKKPRHIDGRFDFIELFIFTLVAVMFITSFLFRHSIVDGSSMENTLSNGEHLIISDLFYTPKYGDIIVCEDYTTVLKKPIVKRVIATEGQTVLITYNKIYVDGVDVTHDYEYISEPNYTYEPLEIIVPEGELFVMGDHRNNSTDSRDIGTISEDAVLGKVILRFYPFNKFGTVK